MLEAMRLGNGRGTTSQEEETHSLVGDKPVAAGTVIEVK